MGRSKKAMRNVVTGLVNKMLLMLLAFGTRTVFIRLLGAEYNGISSLYSNILSVLSLAELGIGNVLTFYLYSALHRKDKNEICCLVNEFKKIYYIIIGSVLTVGLALIPFLKYIVKSELDTNILILYYILYLVNSVASYFVAYRTMVISADQKNYIINNCSTITTIAMYAIQIIYLLFEKDFLGYLIIQVLCTLVNNLILNYIACKKYPFLKTKSNVEYKIISWKDLFSNVKATFLFKVSDTILDQTDNIIISMMFGTLAVGFYSNYYYVITYLGHIAGIVANGLVASFGNLNAEGDKEHSFSMLKVSMLLFSAFGTFCVSCYACVIQDFITIWIGAEYVIDYSIVIAILVVFYLRMVTNTVWIYRSSMGLFKEVQYVNLFAAGVNIILSLVCGRFFGVAGVIVATAISRVITCFWYEGKIVFQKLNQPVHIYYVQQLKDFIVLLAIVVCSYLVSRLVTYTGMIAIIIKLLSCTAIFISVEFCVNYKSREFKILLCKIKGAVKK